MVICYNVNPEAVLSQVLFSATEQDNQCWYIYVLGLIGQEDSTRNYLLTYHFDLRGSTVALTGNSGQVIGRFCYDPAGLFAVQFELGTEV